jgi:PAS domain S-box-containing protein
VVGYAVLGRTIITSILLPITILPTMVAFFAIAHQRALAKVRDSEETMRTLFDTVPTPVVISIPPDGRVERVNRRAVEVFELQDAEHVGRTGPETGVIGDLEERSRMYRELAVGQEIRERELPYRTAGGRRLTMSVNAGRVETRLGARYIFAFHDLTDIRDVEAALKELNASLEQQVADRTRDLESFSYSVSHDLRAPLRAIDGFSALLADELGESLQGPAREHLARIRENCRRMNTLIESLIALSAQGSATLNPVPVDISRLAHEILADLAAAEPDRRVAVRVEPWMRATVDASALRIVLDNLLRNAWKYTARTAQAVIEVGCETRDGLRVYRVRDNGAGFDMARAGELFKPFTRLHETSEFEGSGIGLATVARIVRNLGGRVWAEGKPGEGACFRFTLGPAEARQRGAAGA